MLKIAYEFGIKLALDEDQMGAAQRVHGVAGGVGGAALGGLLGKYLGGRASETFDLDENKSKLIGSLLGSLGGGALGAYTGSQIPKWKLQKDQPAAASALGVLPVAYGLAPEFYGAEDSFGYDPYQDYGTEAYGVSPDYGY